VLPFWLSIGVLSLVQAATVAAPSQRLLVKLQALRSGWWALIPPASILGFVLAGRLAAQSSAQALTYLALVAVPLLAAAALGWLMWDRRPVRPALALLAAPLFVLAWADRTGLAGQTGAMALSALSCVTLGALLGAVTPARWLILGIVAMAIADTSLVVSDLLQHPNNVLNAAHPAAGLPRLQSETFGSAIMGYGDLFVAGVLGGLLAGGQRLAPAARRMAQFRAALLVAVLAVSFDLLFFFVRELPATVPVAVATVLLTVKPRAAWRSRSWQAGAVRRRHPRVGGETAARRSLQ
jgi:hypothetical protein